MFLILCERETQREMNRSFEKITGDEVRCFPLFKIYTEARFRNYCIGCIKP
jgi:hypothetical protein